MAPFSFKKSSILFCLIFCHFHITPYFLAIIAIASIAAVEDDQYVKAHPQKRTDAVKGRLGAFEVIEEGAERNAIVAVAQFPVKKYDFFPFIHDT
jgi:hypothetical protein